MSHVRMMYVCDTCLHDFGRRENLQRHLRTGCKGMPTPPWRLCDVCFGFVKGNAFHLKRHQESKTKCLSPSERTMIHEQQQARRRAQDAHRHRVARAAARGESVPVERSAAEATDARTLPDDEGIALDDLFAMDLAESSERLEELLAGVYDGAHDSDLVTIFQFESEPLNTDRTQSESEGHVDNEFRHENEGDKSDGEQHSRGPDEDHAIGDELPNLSSTTPRRPCGTCNQPVARLYVSGVMCDHVFHHLCFGDFNAERGLNPETFICPACEQPMPAKRKGSVGQDGSDEDDASSDEVELVGVRPAEESESPSSGSEYDPSDESD